MLDLTEVAQYLTDEFNEIGQEYDPSYSFNIYAEIGKNDSRADIQGVLKSSAPKLTPVKDVYNAVYNLDVDLTIPAPRSNFNLKNVENITGEVAKKVNGTTREFGEGSGYLTMSVTGTGGFKTEAGQGDIVTLKFTLAVNYTENTLSAGSKHWLLDDMEIPFISESVIIEKNGKTSPINDRKYQQTFMMTQLKWYHFRFPYVDSDLCRMLQTDLLDGDANKVYTLKYYDGISYTEENPFETKVVIYRNGDSDSQKPETPIFDIMFTDADDGENSTKYYLGVLDNEFDGSSENQRWFDSEDDQIAWYNEKIGTDSNGNLRYCEIKAPNLNSLVLTNQIYTNDFNIDIFDLCNKNYAVIKVERENQNNRYFYYKIASVDIGADNQVIYSLALDSVQTYIFNDDLIIDDSFISKAHLDRWVENEDGTISFDLGKDSKLFEREDIRQVAKRLVSREKMKLYTDNEHNKPLVEWINENVQCWVYIYINSANLQNFKYKIVSANDLKTLTDFTPHTRTDELTYPYSILCYPVLKAGAKIMFNGSYTNYNERIRLSSDGLNAFLRQNNNYSYVYSIKLSMKPPFELRDNYAGGIDYSINGLELYFNKENLEAIPQHVEYIANIIGGPLSGDTGIIRTIGIPGSIQPENSTDGIFYVEYDYQDPIKLTCDLPEFTFTKEEIKGSKNKKYNPKMYSEDYRELRLLFNGNSFTYSMDKINNSKPIFYYTEPLTVDNSKLMIKYKGSENGIFNEVYGKSLNGLIVTDDTSLPIANDELSSYLASNKNAYAQFNAQIQYAEATTQLQNKYIDKNLALNAGTSFASTAGNIVGNLIEGDLGKAVSSAVSGVTNITEQAVKRDIEKKQNMERLELSNNYEKTKFDFSLDNMRNAPQSLMNASGSSIFNLHYDDYGIYAEIYEGLNTELESANDIMYRDGYNLNRFEETGKTIKDYCNTRKYFNYIKAILGNIHGISMSDTMRADLKQRFANGIRFWHQDTVDYSSENYELSLDNSSGMPNPPTPDGPVIDVNG